MLVDRAGPSAVGAIPGLGPAADIPTMTTAERVHLPPPPTAGANPRGAVPVFSLFDHPRVVNKFVPAFDTKDFRRLNKSYTSRIAC